MWLPLIALGSVAWSAPESCPREAELQARLGNVKARVDARVESVGEHFELTVSIDDQVRTLITPSCREAADTTVFLVELATQPTVLRRPLEIRPGPALPLEPPPLARFHLAVTGGAEWLLLPSPIARLGVSAQVDVGPVRLVLDVRSAPVSRFAGGPTPDAGVLLAPSFDAQLGLCHLFSLGRFEAGPCAQASFGLVWATGFNVPSPRSAVIPVWSAGGGLRAAVALGAGFELQAFVAARLGPRPAYSFDADPPVVRTSPLGLDTGLSLGARW